MMGAAKAFISYGLYELLGCSADDDDDDDDGGGGGRGADDALKSSKRDTCCEDDAVPCVVRSVRLVKRCLDS